MLCEKLSNLRFDGLGQQRTRATAQDLCGQSLKAPGWASLMTHRHRLHGRVERRRIALLAAAGEGIDPGISPNIAAVAAELAALDIIAVRVTPLFKHEDKLVLAAVERAHSGIVLDPDAEIFQLAIDAVAGGQQLFDVTPVHADVLQGAV